MPVLRKERVSIGALSWVSRCLHRAPFPLAVGTQNTATLIGVYRPSVFLTLYEGTCRFQGTGEALMLLLPTIKLSFQADTGTL